MKRMLAAALLIALLLGGQAMAADTGDAVNAPITVNAPNTASKTERELSARQPLFRWMVWFARIPSSDESSSPESAEERIQWDWTWKGFWQALFGWTDAPGSACVLPEERRMSACCMFSSAAA